MTRSSWLFPALCVIAFSCSRADAWLRGTNEDAVVVARSELIVVGFIKPGSIVYVPHQKKPGDGASWEHHATLVISSVLKGKADEKEIPIIIHYGMDPLVGGILVRNNQQGFRGFDKNENVEKDQVDLYDSGNSTVSLVPFISHLEKDKLWFLRRRSGIYGREPGTGNFGIVDPEDVALLELKEYYSTYLEKDPEPAVRSYIGKHPEFGPRAARYLDHLEVQRISKMEDVPLRASKLIPYFLKRQFWVDDKGGRHEVGKLLADCGHEGGKLLMPLFDDPAHVHHRESIISFWGTVRFKDATDRLIRVLREQDEYWSHQTVKPDWWNDISDPNNARHRRSYGEVYYTVIALGRIGDSRAKEAIDLTLKRWTALKFPDSQIADACRQALRELK